MNNNKTSRISKLILTFVMVLIISSPMVLVSQQSDDVILTVVQELAGQLQLTQEQTAKIRSIISTAEEQMARDREMFKNNKPALIEAAIVRRNMTEEHIKAVLNPQQKEKYPKAKKIIHFDDQVVSLMEILSITYSEAYQIAEFKRMERDQAAIDRQIYKKSAMALISAANARKNMLDVHIASILNPEQKVKFEDLMKKRDEDTELFELTEGLILTEEQTVEVRRIVEKFREEIQAHQEKMEKNMQGKMGGRSGGMMGRMGGGDKGGKMPGAGGMMGPMSSRDHSFMNELKKLENKKANAIKETLNPEQLALYKQILEKRKEQMRLKSI
jgi:hypothetical protein